MADNAVVSGIIDKIFAPVLAVLKWLLEVIFSNNTIAIIFFIVMINLIAIVLMKKDKEYAQKGERRIREATLLIVALIGGSIGMYYAMFKYKHKTLHKKFSVGVPVIILVQCAYFAYLVTTAMIA